MNGKDLVRSLGKYSKWYIQPLPLSEQIQQTTNWYFF